jgi:hypothetical protein
LANLNTLAVLQIYFRFLTDVTVGEFIEASLKADKAKRGALYSSTTKLKMPFWFAMLYHFKNVSEGREQKPQYVINVLFSLFPVDSNKMW